MSFEVTMKAFYDELRLIKEASLREQADGFIPGINGPAMSTAPNYLAQGIHPSQHPSIIAARSRLPSYAALRPGATKDATHAALNTVEQASSHAAQAAPAAEGALAKGLKAVGGGKGLALGAGLVGAGALGSAALGHHRHAQNAGAMLVQ